MEQKAIVIKMLREQLESELSDIARESIKESFENGDVTGTTLSMNLFTYQEFAIKGYTKIQHDLGLTSEEIKSIVNDCVSNELRKHLQL